MHLRTPAAFGPPGDPRIAWVRRVSSLLLAVALLALGGRGESATAVAPDQTSRTECACAAEAPLRIAALRASAGESWTSPLDDLVGEPAAAAFLMVRRVEPSPDITARSSRRASRTLGGYFATAPPLSHTA